MAPAHSIKPGHSPECGVNAGENEAKHPKTAVSSMQGLTYPSHDCSIHQELPSSWLQDSSLQRGDYVANMKVHNILQLVGCAVQEAR